MQQEIEQEQNKILNKKVVDLNDQYVNEKDIKKRYDKIDYIQKQFAPFLSTSPRNKKQINKIPGPGSYNIASPMIQSKTLINKEKKNVLFTVNQNPGSVFQSKSPRFEQKILEQTPGVGEYQIQNDINKNSHSQLLNNNSQIKFMPRSQKIVQYLINKQPKIASIPKKNQQNDLSIKKEQMNNDDIIDNYSDQIHEKQFNTQKQKCNSPWSKNNENRFGTNFNNKINISPGHYELEPLKHKDLKRQNANFLSKTSKSFWDKLYFNSLKKRSLGEENKNEYFQNGPSPNQYYPEDCLNFKNKQLCKQGYEFFGSSTDRIPQHKLENYVGPTSYKIQTENFRPRARSNQPPFNTMSDRNNLNQNKNQINNPAPGEYQDTQNMFYKLQKKIQNQKTEKFGSNEARFKFKQKDNIFQPGPGRYNIQQSSDKKFQLEQYNFKSQTCREAFKFSDFEKPDLYRYELKHYDINTKVQKKIMYQEKLKKINVIIPPFQTEESRFPHYNNNQIQESDTQQNFNEKNSQNTYQYSQIQFYEQNIQKDIKQCKLQNNDQIQKENNDQNYLEFYSQNHTKLVPLKQYQRLYPHNQPINKPFISSSQKMDAIYKKQSYNVSPGQYESKPVHWIKPTFNISQIKIDNQEQC